MQPDPASQHITGTALEVGFVPVDDQAAFTISALNHTLRAIQRAAYLTAAEALGRAELTAAQRRDYQLIVLDIRRGSLWVILGMLGRNVADTVAKSAVETAIQPLIKRLQMLLSKPEAHSPIEAVTLQSLVALAKTAADGHLNIELQSGVLRFTATPAAYARVRDVPIGYRGAVMQVHGIVSEISLKRNTLTLDTNQPQAASIICQFTPEQALLIRDIVRIGRPLTVRGYAYWTGDQIAPDRPDVVQIEALFDEAGTPRLLPSPSE
jgi:hypothetical protein